MEKSAWDKFSILITFVQIVVIGGFTVVMSFYTSKLNNNLGYFNSGINESDMIKNLMKDLGSDTTRNIKTDFAFLSLQRYLIASNEGELATYDKELLVGFAQSIILDRFRHINKDDTNNTNQILVPKEFLEIHDSLRLQQILRSVLPAAVTSKSPDTVINTAALAKTQPINQLISNNSLLVEALFDNTVYIQYNNRNKRNEVEMARKLISAKGWTAPEGEFVAGRYGNIIKYFYKEDESLVQEIAALLPGTFQTVFLPKYQSKVPKGQVEVWIGK